MGVPRVSISTVTGSPLAPMAGSIGSCLTSVLQVLFLLPAVAVEPLPEVSLTVKQPDADQRNVQIGGALDVIAGQNAQAAGINREGLVQAELRREIRHRPRCAERRHGSRPRCGPPSDIPAGGGTRN